MKFNYINISLFSLSLNILSLSSEVYNQWNHKRNTNSRMLCECELYAPANYDNDPQMKSVMEHFNKQTQQRFHEYDERIQSKRKHCKDKCDKEIQKIILKDKLEKQMEEELTTLDTKINTENIPTCIYEKSIADKVEKGCLRCGGVFGGTLPELGLMGGTALYTLNAWKSAALKAAFAAAREAGVAKGLAAGNAKGVQIVTYFLEQSGVKDIIPEIWEEISSISHYTKVIDFAELIFTKKSEACAILGSGKSVNEAACGIFDHNLGIRMRIGRSFINGPPGPEPVIKTLNGLVEKAKLTANTKAADVISTTTPKIMTKQAALIEGGFNSSSASIYAAIIAIVVIVLIMVIIYLILRRRRKKKMKKKLQYIKLLEE
ncbi:rifin [Plasmodium reichenowi]|uniref:Rifin n=1 Tax=Plasmodium reichenowi TaxID=5854 RepID=A0A060RQ30_PLARE|nr:rifin [Plasmodium reichenowi]